MRAGGKIPDDQAEIVFSDVFFEYLATLTKIEQLSVLETIESLTRNPAGKHPLSNTTKYGKLAGFNTVETLDGEHRAIFRVQVVDGVGVIEVIVGGPRRGDEIYSAANALEKSGKLTADEVTQIWDALDLLEIVSEKAGLNSWDYLPEPGAESQQRTLVGAGVLPGEIASILSKDELNEAMNAAWSNPDRQPDPDAAIEAALRRARNNSISTGDLIASRREPRCGAMMPRAKKPCVRRQGHPGAHRSVA